jgi:hypothetical protein
VKLFSEVEKKRIAYHNDQSQQTVHRSSLLVPRFEHATTVISFLNHFLLKRNYESVTLKITAISYEGKLKSSKSIEINEPRVYTFYLEELFQDSATTGEYLVEFFSTKNLFFPYPAVMINHVGQDFINTVHAYNRVLNDIFEDDEINSIQVCESSIDVTVDDEYDSFFNCASGPFNLTDTLKITLEDSSQLSRDIPIKMDRMSVQTHMLSEIFDRKSISETTLKILQPKQSLFYGRLLAGVMNRKTGAFSANHSYYDSSTLTDCVKGDLSSQSFPYFGASHNRVTMYPINSQSCLALKIELSNGVDTFESKAKTLCSPSFLPVTFDINELVEEAGYEDVSLFRVVAYSDNGYIPTRISLQIKYGPLNSKSKLYASISETLLNPASYVAPKNSQMIWGQVVNDKFYSTRVGICFCDPEVLNGEIIIQFYDESGILATSTMKASGRKSVIFESEFLMNLGSEDRFIWYVARSKSGKLNSQSFHYHRLTDNSSGEHCF